MNTKVKPKRNTVPMSQEGSLEKHPNIPKTKKIVVDIQAITDTVISSDRNDKGSWKEYFRLEETTDETMKGNMNYLEEISGHRAEAVKLKAQMAEYANKIAELMNEVEGNKNRISETENRISQMKEELEKTKKEGNTRT